MSDSSIKSHSFQTGSSNFTIKQTEGEVIVNGTKIPHGYVNVSNMCSVNGSKLSNYLRNKDTLEYFMAVVDYETQSETASHIRAGVTVSISDAKFYGTETGLLVETTNAIGGTSDTYAHIEVALDVAKWISPVLRMWCNKTVLLVMRGEFIAATPAAVEAQKELIKAFDGVFVRDCGRSANKMWNYYAKARLKEQGKTDEEIADYMKSMISNMYHNITGYSSSELRRNMSLPDGENLRNEFDSRISYVIARYEELATSILLRYPNSTPQDAMNCTIKTLSSINTRQFDFSRYQN